MVAHHHSILRGTIDEFGNMKVNEERRAFRRVVQVRGSAVGDSGINVGAVNLYSPMNLTHSLDGIRPFELNENAK